MWDTEEWLTVALAACVGTGDLARESVSVGASGSLVADDVQEAPAVEAADEAAAVHMAATAAAVTSSESSAENFVAAGKCFSSALQPPAFVATTSNAGVPAVAPVAVGVPTAAASPTPTPSGVPAVAPTLASVAVGVPEMAPTSVIVDQPAVVAVVGVCSTAAVPIVPVQLASATITTTVEQKQWGSVNPLESPVVTVDQPAVVAVPSVVTVGQTTVPIVPVRLASLCSGAVGVRWYYAGIVKTVGKILFRHKRSEQSHL
jgi:hypothetical protein